MKLLRIMFGVRHNNLERGFSAKYPIGLIPDLFQSFTYLDDLVIVPLLIIWSVKLIPVAIKGWSIEMAANHPMALKKNKWMIGIIIVIWLLIIYTLWYLLFHSRRDLNPR